jgi:hypothetical protein
MEHGINVEAPRLDVSALSGLADAINSVIAQLADVRAAEAVQLKALDVMQRLLPASPTLSISDVSVMDKSGDNPR